MATTNSRKFPRNEEKRRINKGNENENENEDPLYHVGEEIDASQGMVGGGRRLKLKLLKTYEKNFKSSCEMKLPLVGAEC